MSWSKKYKKSIDCSNPKGFSQKAHCAGRTARQRGEKTKSKSVDERIMKITEQDKKLFKEITSKYNLKKEGFLTRFFTKKLKKHLDADKSLETSLKTADREIENTRKGIEKRLGSREKVKEVIPKDVRKYLGFDY